MAVLPCVLLVVAGPVAQAAGGVWGVGQFPYRDGVICSTGTTTTPLVSWPVGPGGSPGFLVRPVTSDGTTDTGTPPTTGGTVTPLTAGQYGFTTDAQIARYAAALQAYQNAGPQATAALAELIQEVNGASSAQCYGTALDRAYTATLLPAVDRRAGPLAVKLIPLNAAAVLVGSRVSVSASVSTASGAVAAGVPVVFSSPGASFSPPTATTDAAGIATTVATVTDVARTAVPVQASVDNYSRLTVTTAPGAVPAISLASADKASATGTIAVDQSAQPRVTAAVPSAFRTSEGIRASAVISGMNAHAGIVTFTTVGPLPALPGTFCATYDAAAFSAAPAASAVDIPFTGDQTVAAPVRAVAAPGCYTSRVAVRTTNASPPATAAAPPSPAALGVDTAAVLTLKHNGVGGGGAPLEGEVTVKGTYGIPASLSMSSLGPVYAGRDSGTCADVAISPTTRGPASERVTIPGDGVYAAATDGLKMPGCYQLAGTLDLAVPGGPVLSVPISTPGPAPVILAPGLAATAAATTVSAAASTTAHIRVNGMYGYPAELFADLYYLPLGDQGGCTSMEWAKAKVVSTSQPLPITRDGEYDVATAPTGEIGCYSIAPRVVLRDYPDASFTTLAGIDNTVLIGGFQTDQGKNIVSEQVGHLRPPRPGALVSITGLFGIAILFAAVIFRSAFRRSWRRSDPGKQAPQMARRK